MAMAASSSTSASASTSANPNSNSNSSYDIFISHRGPDVKNTFASHLYHRLDSQYRLRVFLDREELQQGDYINSQIEGAIQTASVHVAIFSPGYAESTWCLNELLSMLKSGAPIIPVFYNVKPADLRWTQGKYAQDLQEKEKRHDPATVEQWKKALSKVAGISGFELEACNGDEGELLQKVVDSVLRKVKKTPLNVAKYPTGLDEKVGHFENEVLLRHQHSGIKGQVVGIVGLGGAGKTTLAKEIFNQKSSHYKHSCFLAEVRENVGKGSLTLLQSKILKEFTPSAQIDNEAEGIEKLKIHLSSSEILLILDDVDKVDHVDALLPDQTSLHSNSFILITSRNRDVLRMSGVGESSIYKLDGLSEQHSLELFCSYAFNRLDPLPGFKDLTQRFLKACQGLPLSLKVLGALLLGKNDMSYWHDQLARLESILPEEIQERLKISYDTLDREEKQIFLDIACFLIGHGIDKAIRIWDASRWKGRLGFQNLQNKCLVEVVEDRWSSELSWYGEGEGKKINMHDHIRDLGRDIAGSLLPCRLWRCGENVIDDLVQQSYVNVITVRGIKMFLSEYHGDEEFDSIQMRKLQLVDTEGYLLERILRRVKSPDLIWLCWEDCPYSSLPSWIPMKNLRVLEVFSNKLESKLETLWQQESQLPLCLEDLRVRGCHRLKSMRGMEQATKLQRLDVSECSKLEALPSMETLQSLEWLNARECRKLKSIRGLEQATKLRYLDVSWCSKLEALPSMETLQSLEWLRAEGCMKLKSIRGLEQATKLKHLDVRWCSELEALPSMETLQSLECLNARGCVKLKSIRGLEQATKLRKLDVRGCSELEALPSMETLQSLEWLNARKCVKLKSIRGLEQATKLRYLDVSQCSELEALPSMETLQSLERLFVEGCVKLKSIRGLERLQSLESLKARECVKLKSIRGLEQATKLEQLDIRGCCELEEVEGVEYCTWLKKFDIYGCFRLHCPVWE